MKKGSLILLVILGFVVISGYMGCNTYNSLVQKEETVKEKWGEVQNQYQRRSDLVPNLVNTVKGAAAHERGTLEAVTNARAKATSVQVDPEKLTPEQIQKFQNAQGELTQALGRLMVVIERYPDLKVNQNFLDLQVQLEGTENRITVARKAFNESVQDYNVMVRRFPNNMFASMLGFERKGMFEAEQRAQTAPEVQF